MTDKFPKIHAPIGGVKESHFAPIALKFNVADFHIQVEGSSNDASANHHFALVGTHLSQFFNVTRVCPTNDIEEKSRRFDHFFLHLEAHHVAHKRYFTDVIATTAGDFYQNHIARSRIRIRRIMEKIFPCALFETHFYQIKVRRRIMYIELCEPIKGIHAVTTAATRAITAARFLITAN